MGWADIEVAIMYIARSGALAEAEFERVFGKKEERVLNFSSRRVFYLESLGKKLMERKQFDDDEEWLRCLITQLLSDSQRQHSPIEISKTHYKIYEFLTKKYMYKSQVKNKLKLADYEINRGIKVLKSLGLIKATNPNNKPIFYSDTNITPMVSP